MELPECKYQCNCQQCYYEGVRCKLTGKFCSKTLILGKCPVGKAIPKSDAPKLSDKKASLQVEVVGEGAKLISKDVCKFCGYENVFAVAELDIYRCRGCGKINEPRAKAGAGVDEL